MDRALPLVVITTSLTSYLGEPALRLSENYAEAVLMAGGLPVAAPLTERLAAYDELLNRADGLLLSGGADIDPATYRLPLEARDLAEGDGPCPGPEEGADDPAAAEALVHETTPLRDAVELHLLSGAEDRGLPMLGICRGAQVMNVAHGGTLYQDVRAQHSPAPGTLRIEHDAYMDGRLSHTVEVEADSLLAHLVGSGEIAVNSMHHQAVRTVGRGLVASAAATDGVIEAIERPDGPFMLGVQWHPEYLAGEEPMSRIFSAFVDACAEYGRR